jgi:hypothetical protein
MRVGRMASAVILGVSIASNCSAQARQPVAEPANCSKLNAAIERNLKEISFLASLRDSEESAPRASVDSSEINSRILSIQADIMLINSGKCSPYSHPISEEAYAMDAVKCHTALLEKELSGGKSSALPQICDRSTWKHLD